MTATASSRILPVGLLLEGQACLVVGGGKVAAHKAQLLLDSGAAVTVVAPTLNEDLAALAADGRIRWIGRCFEPGDVGAHVLSYAATDDPATNRGILELCRERKVLCCAVDAGWRRGDFLTPAIIRKDGLVVSVSTSGRACRRSRLVKESLSRHIDSISSAGLIVLGTSHEQLAVSEREPLHLAGPRLLSAGRMLSQVWGLHEHSLLNTCNRIELHMIGVVDETRLDLLKRLLGFDRLSGESFYLKQGLEAFEHTCALCAGLLSQMPGENHIVAQMKQALDLSAAEGWAAGMMREWMSAVLHVSKDIRQATGPHLRGGEIEDLAVDYLASGGNGGVGRNLLILGTGKTGAGFLGKVLGRLPHLQADWCYHQNCPEAPAALRDRVRVHGLDALGDCLSRADIVVSAMSADRYVLTPDHAAAIAHGRPVRLLDLAMPRNIDPTLVDRLPSATCLDLDGLKRWHRREQIDMPHLRRLCADIVLEHRDYYDKLINSFQGRNPEQ